MKCEPDKNPVPEALYGQLKEKLFQKLESGEWPVGRRIPSERQLCGLYGVSRITVRQALAELEKEGRLFRRQGSGTYVTSPKMVQRLSEFYSFSEELARMGHAPEAAVLYFRMEESGEDIALSLDIETGSPVYAVRRLRKADGIPFALETSYLPAERIGSLKEEAVASRGLYNALREMHGIVPDEAVEAFEAVLLGEDEAGLLEVPAGSAGLLLERFTKAQGRVVEYCRSIIRGDRYRYTVVLKKP